VRLSVAMIGVTAAEEANVAGRRAHSEFEDFYRAHAEDVYRTLAVLLRDHDLAREAVDEAMARAFERWRTVRRYTNQPGWVYRVALNWSRSRIRRQGREIAVDAVQQASSDPLPDPSLDRAIADLPLRHREVIVLRYLLDMPQDQVAAVLGIPVGTVKSRLHRALETLREEIDDDT
jgi:RNA polymerase sigma-70 factor (sigma-E family)